MSFQLSAIHDEELVHNAVREGHVISLEIYLNQSPQCINKLYTFNESKWTPLLAACFYKHEHVVRMLLTRFKPDVDAIGTVEILTLENTFELAEEVSPLWIAAVVNDLDIVKLLIEHGNANVNHLTEAHSAPLRAASYRNNLEMVKYLIAHGANPYQKRKGNYTNLMLCAHNNYSSMINYFVTEVKCDINEQDKEGQTALYYAVRSESIEIAKFLLEHGALNIRDNRRKVTPLMRAALFGNTSLVDTFEGYCSDLEWIEAIELLATFFSGCIQIIEDTNKIIEYLTKAFELRLAKNLPKIITTESLEPLICRRECETLEQFNQLINSSTNDALYIESILIHQRLLGNDQLDYHDIIHRYGSKLASVNKYHDCFCWWFYEFELKQKYNITFGNAYLQGFKGVFKQMTIDDQVKIPIDDLLQIFKIMDHILTSDRYQNSFDSNLIILLHLITILATRIHSESLEENQHLSIDQTRQLHRVVTRIVRHRFKTASTGSFLLHLCTNRLTEDVSSDIE